MLVCHLEMAGLCGFFDPADVFSLPGYISAVLYTPVLKKYEPEEQKEEQAGEAEEHEEA